MKIVSSLSLAGGQGKTTVTLFLARLLAKKSKVLLVDSDPQSSLTNFLQHTVGEKDPTLLEVLKKEVEPKYGIYPTKEQNIYLIPSDEGLDKVHEYLAKGGTGAFTMKRRLDTLDNLGFEYCLIDAPPQRNLLCVTIAGASQGLIIPVEASVKGLQSLVRTIDMIYSLIDDEVFTGKILGIVPFRDRWFGNSQAKESSENISYIRRVVIDRLGQDMVLPSIRDSEQYKKGMSQGKTLDELGASPDLAYPIEVLVNLVENL